MITIGFLITGILVSIAGAQLIHKSVTMAQEIKIVSCYDNNDNQIIGALCEKDVRIESFQTGSVLLFFSLMIYVIGFIIHLLVKHFIIKVEKKELVSKK